MAKPRQVPFVAIVEDDEGVQKAIQNLLASAGLKSLCYASAEALLRSRKATAAACVISDMHLPGMNGIEMRRRLRDRGFDTPTLLITSEDDTNGRLQAAAAAAGIMTILYKPFDPEALLQFVRRFVHPHHS